MTTTAMGARTTLSNRIAREIKIALLDRRMSGRQLADKLGVSSAWVSYRLSGKQEIGTNDLERIATVLEMEVTDLIPPRPRPSAWKGPKRPADGRPAGSAPRRTRRPPKIGPMGEDSLRPQRTGRHSASTHLRTVA